MHKIALASFLIATLMTAAHSQSPGPLADCADGPLDDKIAACTKHIEARKLGSRLIALAHSNRGRWYVEKNKPDKALADFNRAIELDPSWTPAYIQRAQIHAAAGRKDQAIADYRKALQSNPADRSALEGLGNLGVTVQSSPSSGSGGGGGGGGLPEMH